MYDPFDSRALRRTNCYAQRFMKSGTYRYNIVHAFARHLSLELPFAVKVGGGQPQAKPTRHLVQFTLKDRRFTPREPVVEVGAGDMVIWNCLDDDAPPHAVVGERDFFASDRMANECGFTQVFGLPGEYRWRDANGSKLAGKIRVVSPEIKGDDCLARWRKQIGKGVLIMIDGVKAKPKDIEVVVGQTVFFAVVKAPGISITDARLIEAADSQEPSGEPGYCG